LTALIAIIALYIFIFIYFFLFIFFHFPPGQLRESRVQLLDRKGKLVNILFIFLFLSQWSKERTGFFGRLTNHRAVNQVASSDVK